MIQQNGGTYQAYTYKQLSVTTEAQTVDYEFTMDKDTDIMTKLCFNCGYFDSESVSYTHLVELKSIARNTLRSFSLLLFSISARATFIF